MSVVVASPISADNATALPENPSISSPRHMPTASRDSSDSIVCENASGMASPRASDSSRSTPDLLPTKPALSKSTLADVTKALEVGHPLKTTHMCALLATYPSLSKDATILHPTYFDMTPLPAKGIPHQPPPPNKVLLAALQHCDPNHWSLVRIHREAAHGVVICRHYDPIPSPQRLQEVKRVMELWAKFHHPGSDVRVSEVSGPKAATSALSGLYVVLGTDEFPATCSPAPTWKPKSPQSAVVAALERYERAASADSGVSMDEEDPSRGSSSGQSSKRGDTKKGIGIGTAKRSKGSLVRSSLSKLGKEKSPVSTPKKASPLLCEKYLPPKPKVPVTPQSEQKSQFPDTPKPKPPSTPLTGQKPKLSNTPQSELKQHPNSSKLNTLPPSPSVKRPRSGSLSENLSGSSEVPVKKRCTPENRDAGGTIQDIDAFLRGLSFPSPKEAEVDMEGSETDMMAVKTKLEGAIEELEACDQEYAERFKTYDQHKKDWEDLSSEIAQDSQDLNSWFSNMPTTKTLTPEQIDQFQKTIESTLNQHRKTLRERHERMQTSNSLLKSAEEVCAANKAKVAKLEVAFAEREAEYREFMKRGDVAKLISEFGDKFGALRAKWEN